ncbi:MAG: hypothetical protein WAM65_13480 [Candidatus Korobacteraceae bacterium]
MKSRPYPGLENRETWATHHVADYDEAILLPGAPQDAQEQVTALVAVKLRTAPITTTGYEVQIVPTVPALQTSCHAPKVSGADHSRL